MRASCDPNRAAKEKEVPLDLGQGDSPFTFSIAFYSKEVEGEK